MRMQKKEDFIKNYAESLLKEGDSEFQIRLRNTLAKSSYKGFVNYFDKMCKFLNAPEFSIYNISIPREFEEVTIGDDKIKRHILAVTDQTNKYFIEINAISGDEYSYWVEVMSARFPEMVTFDNQFTLTKTLMTAYIDNLEDLAKVIAFVFDVDKALVNITLVDPVTTVVVHKIDEFGLYSFRVENDRYLVMIKSYDNAPCEYQIEILKNQHDVAMLSVEGNKSGRLFRSVLLKKLNDWFKETYARRAKFVWGKEIPLN